MHDIWNPWHGCRKCSEGCQNCCMYYLDAVREVSEAPVECVLMRPEEEKIKELLADYPTLVSLHQYELGKLEMPSVEEGFAAVHIIRPEFEDTDWHTLVHSS